jgi:hypothetical protein
MDSGSLDDIIARLLDVRSGRPGKQVQLSEAEIRQLCVTSKDIFLTQPNLLELEAPIKICGNNNNTSSLLFSVLFFVQTFLFLSLLLVPLRIFGLPASCCGREKTQDWTISSQLIHRARKTERSCFVLIFEVGMCR